MKTSAKLITVTNGIPTHTELINNKILAFPEGSNTIIRVDGDVNLQIRPVWNDNPDIYGKTETVTIGDPFCFDHQVDAFEIVSIMGTGRIVMGGQV